MTATLVPLGAAEGAAACGANEGAAGPPGPIGPVGRAPTGGTPGGAWAAAGAIMKHNERGPATKVAHTRESLTLSTPCLLLVILTAALIAEGRAACRLREFYLVPDRA